RSPPVDAQFCLAPPHSFPRLPRPAHFVSFDTAWLLSKGKHGRRRKTYQGSLASLNNQSYHNETCIGSWQWGLSWCWLTGGGLGGFPETKSGKASWGWILSASTRKRSEERRVGKECRCQWSPAQWM